MVLINVKSQLVTLFVTIVTALAELLFTDVVLSIISHLQCGKLENGKPVSIRKHQKTVSITVSACIIVFVIIELIVGSNIDDEERKIPFTEPCVQRGVNTGQEFTSTEKPFRSYLAQTFCSGYKDFDLHIRLSNSSLISNEVSCADDPVFEIHFRDLKKRQIREAKPYCGENEWGAQICLFAELEDRVFSFTGLLFEQGSAVNETEFYEARLFFQPGSQDEISDRLVQAMLYDSAANLDALLSRVFLGSRSSTCTFFKVKGATQVPAAIISLLVVTWVSSLVVFFCAAYYGKNDFLNLGKPLEWTKVMLPSDTDNDVNVNDALICSKVESGTRHLFVRLLPKVAKKK